MKRLIRLLLLPGDWVADRLGVPHRDNRELVRMLVNYVFWFTLALIGLLIWSSTLPIAEP